LEYYLPSEGNVSLSVYDVAGRRVARLEGLRQSAGSHVVSWDTAEMARGVYFYHLRAGAGRVSGKLVLLR
jgi:hypothetical protein